MTSSALFHRMGTVRSSRRDGKTITILLRVQPVGLFRDQKMKMHAKLKQMQKR